METITYNHEDLDGLVEKSSTDPETGLTDREAIQRLLDAYNQRGDKIVELLETIDTINVHVDFVCDHNSEFVQCFHAAILDRMEKAGMYPPENEYDAFIDDAEVADLFSLLLGPVENLRKLNDELHLGHAENQVECD